jgi:putative ABC transport system permease protein
MLPRDLKYGVRFLTRHPAFSVPAILTLALGIGANSAGFSVTYAVVLRQLPYQRAASLVSVVAFSSALGRVYSTPFQSMPLADVLAQDDDFSIQGLSVPTVLTVENAASPDQINGLQVSGDWFAVYGVRPLVGRPIGRDDTSKTASRVVVLSYNVWRRQFGGDEHVIGRSVNFATQPATIFIQYSPAAKPYTVIGVMPPHAAFPVDGDVWIPLTDGSNRVTMGNTRIRSVMIVARLRDGISIDGATARLHAVAVQAAREFPDTDGGWDLYAASLRDVVVEHYRSALLLLLAAVTLLLVLTCVSVGSLVVARNRARATEAMIKRALGATPGQIASQFLVEGMLLGFIGTMIGGALSWWAIAGVRALAPAGTPRLDEIRLSLPVLGYVAAIAIGCGVVLGIAPAIQLRRIGQGVREFRFRRTLVGSQIGLVVPLVVGSALALQQLDRLTHLPLGFDPEHVVTFNMKLSNASCKGLSGCLSAYQDILRQIAALPGVTAAAFTGTSPLGMELGDSISPAQGSAPATHVIVRIVSADYFRALGIPLRSGRTFMATDTKEAPLVAVVNERLAHELFRDAGPGQRFTGNLGRHRPIEVIGTVGDTLDTMATETLAIAYLPFNQIDFIPHASVLVRTTGETSLIVPAVRAVVAASDPRAPVFGVATMDDLLSTRVANPRFQTTLLSSFGTVGLLLAVVGTYGLISAAIVARTREFGIRIALGATRIAVLKLLLGEALLSVGIGVIGGTLAALACARTVSGFFFTAGPIQPVTVAIAATAILIVGLSAYALPARRATRVDPMVALRLE